MRTYFKLSPIQMLSMVIGSVLMGLSFPAIIDSLSAAGSNFEWVVYFAIGLMPVISAFFKIRRIKNFN